MSLDPEAPLTYSRILRFYWPLALSWLFMSIESPISIAIISRLEEAKTHTAAFLMLMGLALWIESPVIDLLSTSTTLGRRREAYSVLRKFALVTMAWCTIAHAAVAATPLYGWITMDLLRLPREVVDALQLPLQIMIPWSACIGWRRFRQGILIRSGNTRAVGLGTAIRVVTMAGVGGALFVAGGLSGTVTTAIALICSVFSESVFVHWASRGAVRRLQPGGEPITLRTVARFHLPLTMTTMLTLTTGPVVGAALAKASNPVLSMAAWQVTSTLVWMHRTVVFALPEVVITLYRPGQEGRMLKRFCLWVGMVASGMLFGLWASGGDMAFFTRVLGTDAETARLAHLATGIAVLFPFINALQSFAKGTLSVHRQTIPRLAAMGVGMTVLLAGLFAGLELRLEGVVFAGLAMGLALFAELGVLAYANVRSLNQHTDTMV